MLLVCFQVLLRPVYFDRLITPGASDSHTHGLVKELEAMNFLHGSLGALRVVKDDKGLAFGLEIRFRHNVDYIAKLLKDSPERRDKSVDLNALL